MPINKAEAANKTAVTINPVFQSTKLSTVNITKKSYIQVKDLEMSYTSNERVAYFTLSIFNGENTSMDFNDYWIKVMNTSGAKFSPVINSVDSKKRKIAPNTTTTIGFSVKLNYSTNLSDLKFQIIKWDFSQPSYERILGTIAVPKSYTTTVPYGSSKMITSESYKLKTAASSLQLVNVGQVSEASVSLVIENSGDKSVKLPEYNYYIRNSAGNYYRLESDLTADTELAPKEKRIVSLYAKLPQVKDKTTYQLYVSSTDTESKAEIPVGYYGLIIKSEVNVYTKPGASKTFNISDVPVRSKIQDILVDGSGDIQNIYLNINYQNIGKEAVSLPGYQYSILTENGTVYPMKAEEFKDSLLPNISTSLSLTATIPSDVSTKGMKLLIQKPKEDKKNNDYLIAIYNVPEMNQSNVSVNTTTLKNKDGLYEVKVNKLQRLPWEDNDIINVLIEVTNKGKEAATVPEIKGSLILNGNKIDEKNVQLIKPQNKLSINAGETIKLVLSTKVPYNYTFTNVSVILSNILSETSSSTIGRFSMTGTSYEYMPILATNEAMEITGLGRQSIVNIGDFSIYEGKDSDLLYVDFKHTNLETRMSSLPRLTGYFIASNGTYVPAEFDIVKDKLNTSSTGLIAAWADIPKNMPTDNLKFYIGESISAGGYTSGDLQADGIVNVNEYRLPERSVEVLKDLKGISFKPYTLNVSKLSSVVQDYDRMDIEFSYDMEMTTPYDKVANGEHKILFELVDGSKKYERSYVLGGTESNAMPLGKDKKFTVTFEESNIVNLVYRGYTLNIYDEVKGKRKLLATKDISAFTSIIPIN